jgi:hypothetical protein
MLTGWVVSVKVLFSGYLVRRSEMFQHVLNPPRRSLIERSGAFLLALALAFVVTAIGAFAVATRSPAPRASAEPVGLIADAGRRDVIQCTTQDGKVVLVGEILSVVE